MPSMLSSMGADVVIWLSVSGRLLLPQEVSAIAVARMIRIKTEINKIENGKSTEKLSGTNSWFFEKFGNINKPVARMTKQKERHLYQE